MFIEAAAWDGARHLNPWKFEYLELLQASLVVNNIHEPAIPLTNCSESERKREFFEYFLNNCGRDHWNSVCPNVSYDDFYSKGFHMIACDRTSSGNNRFTRHTMDRGKKVKKILL